MTKNFSYTIAEHCINDSVLMQQLCDRVYERLYKNLKIQKERIGNSRRGRK